MSNSLHSEKNSHLQVGVAILKLGYSLSIVEPVAQRDTAIPPCSPNAQDYISRYISRSHATLQSMRSITGETYQLVPSPGHDVF